MAHGQRMRALNRLIPREDRYVSESMPELQLGDVIPLGKPRLITGLRIGESYAEAEKRIRSRSPEGANAYVLGDHIPQRRSLYAVCVQFYRINRRDYMALARAPPSDARFTGFI